jgi:hypothetical protein
MNKIGIFNFPTTSEEADTWQPYFTYTALHRNVLLVAKTRIEAQWACYCTPVPGINHSKEYHNWDFDGTKVSEAIALAAFPQFNDLPYAK